MSASAVGAGTPSRIGPQHAVSSSPDPHGHAAMAPSYRDLVEIAASVAGPVAGGVELEVALEALSRLGRTADLGEHDAEVVVRVRELGRRGTDPAQLRDRELGLAKVLEQVGEVVARLGLRGVVLERALVQTARLVQLALAV